MKGGVEFDEKGMLDFSKNLFFGHDVLLLIFLHNIFFFEYFEGIKFVVFFPGDQADLGVSSFPDNTVEMEVVNGDVVHEDNIMKSRIIILRNKIICLKSDKN